MADAPDPLRAPPAVVDFGKALGKDLPKSLANIRKLAGQVKVAASTSRGK